MDELHKRPYSVHPRYQKMIAMIRKEFFWPNMKKEVLEYLAHYLEYQQVKEENQHLVGLLLHKNRLYIPNVTKTKLTL